MNFVWVRTQFEGFHCWEDAPEQTKYLKNRHRHIFHVKVWVSVNNINREIEFITLKNQVNEIIGRIKATNSDHETYSCEMWAQKTKNHLSLFYSKNRIMVSVSEDGENGAMLV